jgi:pimeloyl-ACP methyl ester carboxylesterase
MKHDQSVTRRHVLGGLVGAVTGAALAAKAGAQQAAGPAPAPLRPEVLPAGIRSLFVHNVNGLTMHVLEAGFERKAGRALLLVHGFPELAYSWRKVMLPLAKAGYHVIAPDLRGYGRTSGTDVQFDDDLAPFRTLNEVRDMLGLVSAFGYRSVDAVIGHDFGSPVSAWCAVSRPDVFRSVVLMSAPFAGTATLPLNTADAPAPAATTPAGDPIYDQLAKLNPPRKHYQRYYATREANDNLSRPSQGVHAFLRAYYHMKSADWKQNKPYALKGRTAEEWAKMPRYYIMDLDKGMAETVAAEMPSAAEIAANRWLPDSELRLYSEEYGRTGFQGGLQGYRGGGSRYASETQLFAGRTIDQPSMFIAGRADWGAYQNPGALERMQKTACTRMLGVHFVEGAGHWVQQEQPDQVVKLVLDFLTQTRTIRN